MDDEVFLVVKSIDLLTVEEVEELPLEIQRLRHQWWIQPLSYYQNFVRLTPIVGIAGKILYSGSKIFDNDNGVRPALLIENLDSLNFLFIQN